MSAVITEASYYGTSASDSESFAGWVGRLGGGAAMFGNGGDDELTGSESTDQLVGGDGNDELNGRAWHDHLEGGAGNDILDGGAHDDEMWGGAGNDAYRVDDAGDRVYEASAAGTDRVISSVDYTLGNNIENLVLGGTALVGAGNTLDNKIEGNSQHNKLSGGSGDDELIGNNGNDVLSGGAGNDVLRGGAGTDVFVFNTALNASTNMDRITGFSSADDTIRLDNDVFTQIGFLGTAANSAFFHVGTGAHDASDRIIYDSSTGNLFYDADGSGAATQVRFANLAGEPGLSHTDFSVID